MIILSDVIAGDIYLSIPKLRGINIYWTLLGHYLSVNFCHGVHWLFFVSFGQSFFIA